MNVRLDDFFFFFCDRVLKKELTTIILLSSYNKVNHNNNYKIRYEETDMTLCNHIKSKPLFSKKAVSLGVAMALSQAVLPNTVFAEETAEESGIEVIVVTSQKRVQNLQEVPISVTALGEDELKAMGADDFGSYANNIPGVNFQNRGPGRNKIVVRGISPSVGTSAATVGVYIDDMPIADQTSNPDLKMFDIDRVEVLRGPQGTLYGEGSMGGTIRIITNQPDVSDFSTRLEATYGDISDGGNEVSLNGMVNIPLIEDTLGLRVVAYGRDNDGWINNIHPTNSAENINNEETDGYRASLKLVASDNLSMTLMAMHQNTDVGGQTADGGFENSVDFFSATGVSSQPSSVSNNEISQAFAETINDEFDRYNLAIDYELSFATLTSVSSYFDRTRAQTTNNPPIAAGRGLLEGHFDIEAGTKTFTQEIRLVSNSNDALQWTVGAFYKDSERTETQFDLSSSMIDVETYIGSLLMTGVGVITPGADSSMVIDTKIDVKQMAVFADFTYQFDDKWSASIGGRYFEEEQKSVASLGGSVGFSANAVFGFPPLNAYGIPFDPALLGQGIAIPVDGAVPDGMYELEDDAFNPRFNVSYTPDEDTLIYVTASQGFRSGGVNVFAHAQQLAPALGLAPPITIKPSYESDSLWNYEIGYKGMSDDATVRLNAAAYYQDWSDVQVAEMANGAFVIVNGGSAHSMGIEAELTILLTDDLLVSLGVSYVEAEFDEDLQTGAFAKGDSLPDVPSYNFSLAATYNFYLTDDLPGYFRADISAVDGSSLITPALDGSTEVDGYQTANLRLGIDSDTWYASIYINNLTDEVADLGAEFSRGGYYHNKPRTIGLTVGYSFY